MLDGTPGGGSGPGSTAYLFVVGVNSRSGRSKKVLNAKKRRRILSWSNWELLPGFSPGFHLQSDSPDDAVFLQ
jgi:hypothetical protein